ncbi:MAG: hypothetical protein QM844_00475, partial [Planctomycetota bacterium]|nr:hypothetical protein [Planctomycetota bacterium]
AEIAALNQGIRNAQDGISMIQTAEGALSGIDEKLTAAPISSCRRSAASCSWRWTKKGTA